MNDFRKELKKRNIPYVDVKAQPVAPEEFMGLPKAEKSNAERLAYYIENGLITDDQLDLVVRLLNGELNSPGDIMRWVFGDDSRRVDSAYPIGYTNKYVEQFPPQTMPNFCYSYVDNTFGELVNLDRMFMTKIFQIIND